MRNVTKFLTRVLFVMLGLFLLLDTPLTADSGCGEKTSIILERSTYGKDCKGCHAKKRKKKSRKRMNVSDLSKSSQTVTSG